MVELSQIQSFLPAHSEIRFSATSEATSTPTGDLQTSPDPWLAANQVSPQPAKVDPPLPASSHRCQIVREVRVSMSEQSEKHFRALKVSMSELWEQASEHHESEHVRVVGATQACQSCASEHVGVKRVHVKDVKGDVTVANN